jgi:hypothetical protein
MRIFKLVVCLLAGGLVYTNGLQATSFSRQETLPVLKFTEVLDVVAIGVQIEKKSLINRDPSLKAVYRDAESSFRNILESGSLDPEAGFGKLQSDLAHHQGREYSMFLQSFMDVMNLYAEFYRLNEDLFKAGVRTPFSAFLGAIHQGLRDDAQGKVLIAGDGGPVNPMNMIRSAELVFTSW